ncbi:MAG TPA: transcription antitermination factor NusB [Candidatus Acidoferrales bacterium]|nr:transcription antitermination factor NusB [Candidatus Acidoferrales bacterium]
MGARRKGRELAVQALYQIDVTGEASVAALKLFFERADAGSRAKEFSAALVAGVHEQQTRIDELIAQVSEHWRFERLSRVDLNVLRVAAFELMTHGAPTSVVLDEAIEIARRFGTEESAVFVNGILDQIAARLGVKEEAAERRTHGNG